MDILKIDDATMDVLETEGYPLEDILMMCRMKNINYGEVDIDRMRYELDKVRGIK